MIKNGELMHSKPHRDPVKRAFAETELGQMHLRIAAPLRSMERPLVCLHMAPQSGRSFENFLRAACKDRLVIAPDYHGYGESDPPPATLSVSIEDYARTNWQALDSLGISKVDLLGHHTGSKVACEMATQRPSSVNAIALVSASCRAYQPLAPDDDRFTPPNSDSEWEYIWTFWNDLSDMLGVRTPASVKQYYFAEFMRSGRRYAEGFRAAYEYNAVFKQTLEALDHEILVVNPKDDLYEITPKIMKHLRKAEFLDMPHWGHGFLDWATEESVDVLLGGLKRISRSKPKYDAKKSHLVLDETN